MRRLLLLAPVVVLAVACDQTTVKPFQAAPTAKCLRAAGFTVSTGEADVGLVAATAANGGLRATPKGGGNTLIMAFAADGKDAANIEQAIRRTAPAALRPHLSDIMTVKQNAVLLWTVTPSAQVQQAVLACLKT
jgi:hypothetical protein